MFGFSVSVFRMCVLCVAVLMVCAVCDCLCGCCVLCVRSANVVVV